jgi:hypothetical protein
MDGYLIWSAQDCFEWVDRYGTRFGLIYGNFDMLDRIPKLSVEWFREAARQDRVVEIPAADVPLACTSLGRHGKSHLNRSVIHL